MDIARLYKPPIKGSFFLFGPRGVGKSTWVREQVRPALTIDLLRTQTLLDLQRNPSRLEALVEPLATGSRVLIDEIQKLPELLDEAHRLIESRKLDFVLTGSSARKLKRSGSNLLGGRAQTRRMFPFSLVEFSGRIPLADLLRWGSVPVVWRDPASLEESLASYVDTYLREEIKEEALVRRVEEFARFLEIAGQLHGQPLNFENVARETGKSGRTVQSWYQILEETLLGIRIPPYRPGFKVRESGHSKFYWFDQGVAYAAAGLVQEMPDRTWLGTALETLILNELRIYNEVSRKERSIMYYGVPGAGEVDFVVETKKRTVSRPGNFVTIEVKLSPKWRREFERPSRAFKASAGAAVTRMFGVYTGKERLGMDGFEIFPVDDFVHALHQGELF